MTTVDTEALALAERVRALCLKAARAGYEDAAVAGLCGEGALEAAPGAVERLDLAVSLTLRARSEEPDQSDGGAPENVPTNRSR